MDKLPSPETMLTYASILEKPQYQVDPKTGIKYRLAIGEIIEAACAALRMCAEIKTSSKRPADHPGIDGKSPEHGNSTGE